MIIGTVLILLLSSFDYASCFMSCNGKRGGPPPVPDHLVVQPLTMTTSLNDGDWVKDLDYNKFTRELDSLGYKIASTRNDEDAKHYRQLDLWRNIFAGVGIATIWTSPNPLTVFSLSMWNFLSWTIAHHTMHGAYDFIKKNKKFAIGSHFRRFRDWCDWIYPEAWLVNHRLHHEYVGEMADPDGVDRDLNSLRHKNKIVQTLAMLVLACTWKWSTLSPNSYFLYSIEKADGTSPLEVTYRPGISSVFLPVNKKDRLCLKIVNSFKYFADVLFPVVFLRFLLLPALFLAIPNVGRHWARNALINSLLAETLTNLHGFIMLFPNHCGSDLYQFKDHVRTGSPSYKVRQFASCGNMVGGDNVRDAMCGYLNYQLEHHLWPKLTLRQLQRAAPMVQELCARHGVPYVTGNPFARIMDTMQVMNRQKEHLQFPVHYEPHQDKNEGIYSKRAGGNPSVA